MSKLDSMLVLYNVLDQGIPENLPEQIRAAISKSRLPGIAYTSLPILRKNKDEKEMLLKDLWICATSAEEIEKSHANIIKNFLIHELQKGIEKCYFECVIWNTRIKKVAGSILFIPLHFFLILFCLIFCSIFMYYSDTSKQRFGFRKKLGESNEKLRNILKALAVIVKFSMDQRKDIESGKFPWEVIQQIQTDSTISGN